MTAHTHSASRQTANDAILAPGQGLLPKYTSGFYDGGRLFVGRGAGNGAPVPRINNPQEVVFFDLIS
ncbi:MAG: serine/threonine protein phosphatase, partial [Clostridia bacterium]|nr:serine/threonine protein phosphatase [Clostridia bacterium]